MPNGIGSRLDQGLTSQRNVCLRVTGEVIDLGVPVTLDCTVEFFMVAELRLWSQGLRQNGVRN